MIRRIPAITPEGYIHIRKYCKQHGVSYGLIYSRINSRRIPYIHRYDRYYLPVDLDPKQFIALPKGEARYNTGRLLYASG